MSCACCTGPLLISQGSFIKSPQIDNRDFIFLWFKRPAVKNEGVRFLLDALRGKLSHASLLAPGGCQESWCFLASGCLRQTLPYLHMAFSVCMSMCPLLQGLELLDLGPALIQYDLNSLYVQRPYFQIRSHCEIPGGSEFGGHTIQFIQVGFACLASPRHKGSRVRTTCGRQRQDTPPWFGGKRGTGRQTPMSSCLT